MSGYIHSGVYSKMNKILKPTPGSILISDENGNAVESGKTFTDIVGVDLSHIAQDLASLDTRITTLEENSSGSTLTINSINSTDWSALWQ